MLRGKRGVSRWRMSLLDDTVLSVKESRYVFTAAVSLRIRPSTSRTQCKNFLFCFFTDDSFHSVIIFCLYSSLLSTGFWRPGGGHMTMQRDLRSLRRRCWYSLSSCKYPLDGQRSLSTCSRSSSGTQNHRHTLELIYYTDKKKLHKDSLYLALIHTDAFSNNSLECCQESILGG